MNVCCVPWVERLRESVVQSVKIVVLEDMAIVVRNVKPDSIANPRWMILRRVSHAVSESINQALDKQAAFHAHLENINILKEKKHV